MESRWNSNFQDKASVNKFNLLKGKTIDHCIGAVDRIKKIVYFIKNHLNTDETDALTYTIGNKCSYLEDSAKILLDLESKLDKLEENYPTVKEKLQIATKIKELLSSGVKLLEANKYHEAIKIYSKAIDLKPSNESIIMELLFSRASANSKIGNFRDAIIDCSNVLTLSQELIDVRLLRAQCYDNVDELEKCIGDYECLLQMLNCQNDVKSTADVQLKLKTAQQKLKHKLAQQGNNTGNEDKNNRSAEKSYTKANELGPKNTLKYIKNSYETLIMLGEYSRALQAAQLVVDIDGNGVAGRRGYQDMIKLLLILGKYYEAGQALVGCVLNMRNDKEIRKCRKLYKKLLSFRAKTLRYCDEKCYQTAIYHAEDALKLLPESIDFKFIKAECLMYLGRIQEIGEMEKRFGFSEADRLYLKSIRSYYNGDLENTLSLLGQSVALDQDHDRSSKMQKKVRSFILGSDSHDCGTFGEVVEACTDALEVFPSWSYCKLCEVLLKKRAIAHSKIGNYLDAISDCSEVLNRNKHNIKVLLLRAKCYEHVDKLRESMNDYVVASNSKIIRGNVIASVQITTKIEHLKTRINHSDAKGFTAQGDTYFNTRNFYMAVHFYNKAINCWPENISLHVKRIVCFMKMLDYKQALQKCEYAQSININSSEINKYMTECSLILGDVICATMSIQKYRETGAEKDKLHIYEKQLHKLRKCTENTKEYMAEKNFQKALRDIDKALEIAHGSYDLKILRAECLALLGHIELANQINADAVYVRALCVYQTDLDRGLDYLKRASYIDPDHRKTKELATKLKMFEKKRKRSTLLQQEKYREASDNLSEALQMLPAKSARLSTLLYNLRLTTSKIGRIVHIRDAVNYCAKAITNKWLFTKLLKLRANCLMSIRNFGRAVEDFKTLLDKESSDETKNMLELARSSLQRQQSSNYYDILDIEKNETPNNIKKAYRKLALIHHPDKHSNAPQDERSEQQEIFKRINDAYKTLSDPQKRAAYDRRNR